MLRSDRGAHEGRGPIFAFLGRGFRAGAAQAAGSPLSYSETEKPFPSQIIRDSASHKPPYQNDAGQRGRKVLGGPRPLGGLHILSLTDHLGKVAGKKGGQPEGGRRRPTGVHHLTNEPYSPSPAETCRFLGRCTIEPKCEAKFSDMTRRWPSRSRGQPSTAIVAVGNIRSSPYARWPRLSSPSVEGVD